MIANLAPITLVLVVLLSTLHHGEAIICYQCNSEYDPRCGDPFDSYSLGTVNCSFQPRLEHMSHLEPTLCRKISQKVYGKIRVVRGCGYIAEEKSAAPCVKRSGTHDVQAVYCSCTGDLCNAAEGRTPPSYLLPFTSLLTVVLAAPSFLLSNSPSYYHAAPQFSVA